MQSKIETNITCHSLDPQLEIGKIKFIWEELSKTNNQSYFLTWHWVENWIFTLPNICNLQFVYAMHQGSPLLGCFLGMKKGVKHKIISATRAYLNETGEEKYDAITIYNNGLLGNISSSISMLAMIKILQFSSQSWHELICNAIPESQLTVVSKCSGSFDIELMERGKSFYVDLKKVREEPRGLLGLVSRNRRNKINQSIKNYSRQGRLSIKIASSKNEAMELMNKLIELHQLYWRSKGDYGSFSNQFFKNIHTNLITRKFDTDLIHLVGVYCGDKVIGVLYNFILDDCVSFYQCGFSYSDDNKLRPGLVSHYLAIEHYAAQGLKVYDFMAGESSYKESLATDEKELFWIKVQKKMIRFKVERVLRKIKGLIYSHGLREAEKH